MLFGDCRDMLRHIGDESVDLVVTDPPYNTGITASASRLRHFFDDALPAGEYRELATAVSRELYRVLKQDHAVYVFINWKSLGVWLDALSGAGFRLKNCVVWDKVLHGLNYQNYAHTHEFLVFGVKGRFLPRNKGGDSDAYTDVWHVRRETRQQSQANVHHETVKPFDVVRRPIEHASDPGDLVLDPFAGSGTTCVVAKALSRRYIGIEKSADYYRLSLRRLTDLELVEVGA